MHKIKCIGALLAFVSLFISSTFAVVDLQITDLGLSDNSTQVAQFATPFVDIEITNIGTTNLVAGSLGAGFVRCTRNPGNTTLQEVYVSNPVSSFSLSPGGNITITTQALGSIITNAAGPKTIECTVDANSTIPEANENNNATPTTFDVIQLEGGNFDRSLIESILPIQSNLNAIEPSIGAQGAVSFVIRIISNVVIPIIVVIAVLIALLGLYKALFSNQEDSIQQGIQYIIWGVVGIIVMMMAQYVTNVLFDTIFQSGDAQAFSAAVAVEVLYDQVVYPLLTLVSYIAVGVLFVILLARVFSFFTSNAEDAQKKATTIIVRSVVATLIILGARQIVELVYGRRDEVLNQNAQNLGDIGEGILVNNIPLIYQIINRILGITAFIVLILIIIQSYKLLTNPDNEDNLTSIKKTLGYIFIGVIVIGAGYVIVNFLIIN